MRRREQKLTGFEIVAVLAAGFAAGIVTTIAGSASLITYPTLLAVGYPPVLANVSNTVGLWPGSVSGAIGYRRELSGQLRRCLVFGVCSAAGAVTGGLLLLWLPGSVFERVVPILILFACGLLAVQPYLLHRVAAIRSGQRGLIGIVGVYLAAVYGGYFGAAQAVILIALLGIVLDDGLQRLNALKNVLAAVVNLVAAALFVTITDVAWLPALLLAAGSIAGGQVGAVVGRRIRPDVLRWTIIVVGVVVATLLLI